MVKNLAILHIIHWFLLATTVYLSDFDLVPIRLLGSILAYFMIVGLPLVMYKKWLKSSYWPMVLNIYLFYIWVIFMGTYTARIKNIDDFQLASLPTFWLLIIFTISLMVWRIYHLAVKK